MPDSPAAGAANGRPVQGYRAVPEYRESFMGHGFGHPRWSVRGGSAARVPVPPVAPCRCWISLAGALLGALVLAGCASVGPDFHAPPAPAVSGYLHGVVPATTGAAAQITPSQQLVAVSTISPGWWTGYRSRTLDDLIDRALKNNQSLAATEAALRQARETYAAQSDSTRYPTVNGSLGASRNRVPGATSGQPRSEERTYNLYSVGIDVAYNFDLFGGNRRALEALAAQADYQAFQLAGARLALAGTVVAAAVTQAELGEQIAATQTIVKAQEDQLAIARKRFALHAVSRVEVLTLRTQLEQTRATLPPLRNRLQQTDHLLAVLIGQAPGDADIPRFTLADFTLPPELPLVVPSNLVRQRPDIRAATALLHAATAQYGVAVSALYPQIDLSARVATEALTTSALFGPGSTAWTLAGQLAQPLFNAGLKAGARAAEARMQGAGATYRDTVLQALRQVADVLRQLDNDAQALDAQRVAARSSRESFHLIRQQYRLGAASYLQLLTAEEQVQQARVALIAARAARLADSAALYQAMGGGVLATAEETGNAAAVRTASPSNAPSGATHDQGHD